MKIGLSNELTFFTSNRLISLSACTFLDNNWTIVKLPYIHDDFFFA